MRTIEITQNEEVKRKKVTSKVTECSRTKAQKVKQKFCKKTNRFTIIASNLVRASFSSKLYFEMRKIELQN